MGQMVLDGIKELGACEEQVQVLNFLLTKASQALCPAAPAPKRIVIKPSSSKTKRGVSFAADVNEEMIFDDSSASDSEKRDTVKRFERESTSTISSKAPSSSGHSLSSRGKSYSTISMRRMCRG